MISVIIPAHNEEAYIGDCLASILKSHEVESPVQVIVVANGCTDATVSAAQEKSADFEMHGWQLDVVELAEGGKVGALNAGDDKALFSNRIYLDADIHVSPGLISQIAVALDDDGPIYAGGRPRIRRARTAISERYARFWERLPFMAKGVPGCGAYAVTAKGRAKWGKFPKVTADDTFVRYHFNSQEMIGVAADYSWPIAEGFGNLVRVRRRQDEGLREIRRLYPELASRALPTSPGLRCKLSLLLQDPIGFMIYSTVALTVRTPFLRNRSRWDRSR